MVRLPIGVIRRGCSFGGTTCTVHMMRNSPVNSFCNCHCGKICRGASRACTHSTRNGMVCSRGNGIVAVGGNGAPMFTKSTGCSSVGRSNMVGRCSVICLKGSGPGFRNNKKFALSCGG